MTEFLYDVMCKKEYDRIDKIEEWYNEQIANL